MAGATITNGSFGFKAVTGTDATVVVTGDAIVKSIIVTSGGDAGNAIVSDGNGVAIGKFTAAANSSSVYSFPSGLRLSGVKVTLSDANTYCIINVE